MPGTCLVNPDPARPRNGPKSHHLSLGHLGLGQLILGQLVLGMAFAATLSHHGSCREARASRAQNLTGKSVTPAKRETPARASLALINPHTPKCCVKRLSKCVIDRDRGYFDPSCNAFEPAAT